MVSISNLINSGLLLVNQNDFGHLASPQQSSRDSYNIANLLGGSAPYVQRHGSGIDSAIPSQCTLQQVQLLSRHGERFPSLDLGASFESINKKFQSLKGKFTGDLSFLNDYTYFVPNEDLYEKETSPKNSKSVYAGTITALKEGAFARSKYGELYKVNSTLPIFSSNSGRCFETAEYFTRGFLGDDYAPEIIKYVVVTENGTQGANSLTPRTGCSAFNYTSPVDLDNYDSTYLSDISKRLTGFAPGLNLSSSDVYSLFSWCAFEINVRGASQMCDIFTNEEFIKYSYSVDLSNYYENGPGNNLSVPMGSQYLNASLKLLTDTTADNKVWFSFTHDTDLEIFHAALGLLSPAEELPVDHVQFPFTYQHAQIVPQGARIYTEKYSCSNTSYVRYVINDAVVPLANCSSGPGFSCKLSDFQTYVKGRINNVDYNKACKNPAGTPDSVTFYWDYKNTTYNAPLGNF